MKVNGTDWTVIARNTAPGVWIFTGDWTNKSALAASDADDIIMMHRRGEHGWQLVARLAGPAWKHFQKPRRRV